MSSAIKIIIVYILAALPILGFYLGATFTHDYFLIFLIDMVIFHFVLPVLLREATNDYTKVEEDYNGFVLSGREYDTLLMAALYMVGWVIFHFTDLPSYGSATLLLPDFSSKVLSIIYAILTAIFFVIIYAISEHNFYYGFIRHNIYGGHDILHVLVTSLFNALKWYFLFVESKEDSAIAWTIFWFAMYFIIGFNTSNDVFYAGSALRQLFYLFYVITLALYAFDFSWMKNPGSKNLNHGDNVLKKLGL